MSNDAAIKAFWHLCREEGPASQHPASPLPEAWGFGADAEMADRLGALVVEGTKTATSSALWEYEHDGSSLPRAGDLGIVLDGSGEPLCLIETTDVEVHAFDAVPEDFAAEEGEGDRSLARWRDAHWEFFSAFLPRIGRQPSRDMPVVCERFRVLAVA